MSVDIENMFKNKRIIVANRIFFIGFIFIMAGILSAFLIYSKQFLFAALIITPVVGIYLYLLFKKNIKRFLICFVCLVLGILSFTIKTLIYENNKINEDLSYNVTGHVSDIVYFENGYTRLTLNDCEIEYDNEIFARGKISLLIFNMTPKYGDVITFNAKLENIDLNEYGNFAYNPTVDVFYSAKISSFSLNNNYFNLDELIRYSVKDKIEENFKTSDSAGLAYAVMFGDKQILDFETETSFRKVGVTHLIAVSGLNISILFLCIMWLIKKITNNRVVLFVSMSVIILFYVWLCGFAPSVTRAGLMCLIYCLSKCTLSRYDILNSMGLSGLIILTFSPYQLFNVGFVLSYACIFGIVALAYIFNKLFKFLDFNEKLKTSIVTCLSAQLVTFAITAWCYGNVSLIGLIANVLLVPIFEMIFMALVVVLIVSFIIPVNLFYRIINFGFEYTINISRFLAEINFAETSIFKITAIGCVLCLVICYIISDKLLIKNSIKCIITSILLCAVIFTSLIGNFNMLKSNNITTIGESNFVVVTSRYRMTILDFDIGSLYDLNKYLFNTSTYKVENIIICSESNLDYDGFEDFIINYNVENIYISSNVYDCYIDMFNFINLENIKINIVNNYDEFDIGTSVKYYEINDKLSYMSLSINKNNIVYYNGDNIGDIEMINTLITNMDYFIISKTIDVNKIPANNTSNILVGNYYYKDNKFKNIESCFTINL